MQSLHNRVVAVTGAASGIGRDLALALAKEGAQLALSDVNAAGLEETVGLCGLPNGAVHQQTVDVANRLAVMEWAANVADHFGAIHVIINNAGVALNASVEHVAIEDMEWLMGINFWGVVHGTQAFLPYIKRGDWGHVVNLSSLFGIIAVPNQNAYNAAKFAVRGFTESLHMEMSLSDYNIGVSCVHPGGVATNIANDCRHGAVVGMGQGTIEDRTDQFNQQLARTSSEQAARIIVDAIKRNKPRVLVGNDARIADLVARLLPTGYRKLLLSVFNKAARGNG